MYIYVVGVMFLLFSASAFSDEAVDSDTLSSQFSNAASGGTMVVPISKFR